MPARLPLVYLARPPRQPIHRPPLLVLRLHVLSVRAPVAVGQGAYAWYPMQFTPEGSVIAPEHLEAARSTVLQFTWEARELVGTEASRTYLLGFS